VRISVALVELSVIYHMRRPLCKECGERVCEILNKFKKTFREKCWRCRSFNKNPERYREVQKQGLRNTKVEVINHYGGRCNCCGENNPIFLTIDHINGGGTTHRKQLKRSGSTFSRWLKNQGYPPGYQVLCFNCNCGRQINGGICPHQTLRGRKRN
jgi:hypothetical protein